jgi:hypothetical protein
LLKVKKSKEMACNNNTPESGKGTVFRALPVEVTGKTEFYLRHSSFLAARKTRRRNVKLSRRTNFKFYVKNAYTGRQTSLQQGK